MDPELYEECKKALYVVKADGTRLRGADAVLFAMQETGKGLWAVLRVPPIIWIARLVYRWIAQNRGLVSKLFFKGETCNLKERYSGKEE